MIKTITVTRNNENRMITLPKKLLEESGLIDERYLQIQNIGGKLIITKIENEGKDNGE
jgi:hypothetical protein